MSNSTRLKLSPTQAVTLSISLRHVLNTPRCVRHSPRREGDGEVGQRQQINDSRHQYAIARTQ